MEETIDFSGAKLEDFKLGENTETEQVSEVETQQEQASPEVKEPAPAEVQQVEKIAEPSSEPKPEPTVYQFKDDFIKGVVEFYEKTGDLTPYLQAKTIDFEKMSDEDVLRRNLREQYSDISDKAFERLYKQQVVDKYKLDADEWGQEDSELGRELLKTEASKIRSQYMDWQKNFSAPDQPEEDNSRELEIIAKFENDVKNNELTKKILSEKRIQIKVGDGEFNYEVANPNELLDMTVDNDKFFSQFALGQGSLDYAKWYKTVAYSQNPELFERSLVNYGKALGREEVTKEIKNPSTNPVGDVPTESSGDFTTGLLQAFASRGISSK